MRYIFTAAALFILFSNSDLFAQSKKMGVGEIGWVKDVKEIYWSKDVREIKLGKLPSGVVQWEKELIVIPNYAEVSCGEVK